MVRKASQSVTASQEWKNRMAIARKSLPKGIGQQKVLDWITTQNPSIDRLTFYTRWHNAWLQKAADPEFTQLVEQAVQHFKTEEVSKRNRLRGQKLATS
ncbi:hypothetical protein IC229_05595 [Spirosoma sp. BT702]|uniref:Uncharacterized protein n=1 Tax=Spirosoma profusum TaxID=2771354 RepID=A0A926XYD8_9BACT|nr:hypothetical protein [Spirosoma profusum]MBD2700098.1 hypothetical protein [Spirosoma profusum]